MVLPANGVFLKMGAWLKSFLGKVPERPLPPGGEIFAVGDIHGRLDLLCDLLDQIIDARSTERPELIFLGELDFGRVPPHSSVLIE